MKEKTYVEDVNRSIYDIRNEEKDVYRVKEGLTPEIVDQIIERKTPDPGTGWQNFRSGGPDRFTMKCPMPDCKRARRIRRTWIWTRYRDLCPPEHADEVRNGPRFRTDIKNTFEAAGHPGGRADLPGGRRRAVRL